MQHLKERFFDPQRVRERQVTIHERFALFNTVDSVTATTPSCSSRPML